MFTTPKALLTLSFLVSIVNSTPHPSAEDLDFNSDDALMNTNMFLDGLSNSDDLMTSDPLMSMFDSDLSIDADPLGDQETLFAVDPSPGNSCSAEDSQSFPMIGKLRRREDSLSWLGAGKSCITTTTQQDTDKTSDSFLLRLPIADDLAPPQIKSRRDICPMWQFGLRDIALCSAASPRVAPPVEGIRIIIVDKATLCTSSADPGRRFSQPSVGVWLT